MTFEELVKQAATDNRMSKSERIHLETADGFISNKRVKKLLTTALKLAIEAAKANHAPLFPGVGRLVFVPVRSTGRRVDGTVWSNPGRTKLALRASTHVGGRQHKPQTIKSITPAPPVAAVG